MTSDIVTMPANSLWQPWASLWLIPEAKVHETRDWRTPRRYIGKRILVHAAKKRVPLDDLDSQLIDCCRLFIGPDWRERVPYGAFAGAITLAGSKSMGGLVDFARPAHEWDQVCGHWAPHRHAWRGDRPRTFAEPVPAVGHQGFWLAGIPAALVEPTTHPELRARKPLGLYAPNDAASQAEPAEASTLAQADGDSDDIEIPSFLRRLAGAGA